MQNGETRQPRLTGAKVFTASFFIRHASFFLIALLALAIRLPELGQRPMHTDEAVNAYITGQLLAGQAYHYDPQDRHGPLLYLMAEPLARMLGAKQFSDLTETQLRLTPVLAGCVTILLFGAGVELFGFTACLMAALLFAFAPLPLYYNRYFIHETLFVAATWGLIICGWRAWQTNSLLAAALTGGCAALMLAAKETAVIHFFAIAVAWLWTARTCPRLGTAQPVASSKGGNLSPHAKWLKAAATAGAVFVVVAILLFTWGGQNWSALAGLLHAIPNFTARAGGEGHEKPFWYYTVLLAGGWSGAVLLFLGAAGIVLAFRRPRAAAAFALAVYALVVFAIYSAIPYKTPWLALNFWLPLALLAGLTVERIWFAQPKLPVRAGTLAALAMIGILMAHDTRQWVFLKPADEKNPYAYAHTGEDLLRLPGRLEQLARQSKITDPRIAVVAADAWPLPWYLRKFSQVGYWQPGQATGPADFFITSTDVSGPLTEQLKHFRPEYFGWRPNVLLILWVPVAENPATGTPPPPQPT